MGWLVVSAAAHIPPTWLTFIDLLFLQEETAFALMKIVTVGFIKQFGHIYTHIIDNDNKRVHIQLRQTDILQHTTFESE